DADRIARQPLQMLPNQDLTGLCLVGEPPGLPEEPSSYSARDRAPAAHDRLAGLESDAERGIEPAELDRSPSSSQRVVLVHDGDAEHRQQAAGVEGVGAAAVPLDDTR